VMISRMIEVINDVLELRTTSSSENEREISVADPLLTFAQLTDHAMTVRPCLRAT
jgi:hypothetical protein